eukprot:CAMPEP_0176383302 /NCGR_PEP_ID=MMETSP0126-20121128/33390_1 /TAXON_ID=141414 ORGANISM="Strombidinopsis acuminatum, Strain SPMC142" /NCGR_SAMPLE_ID=MMETSP0126 /ASSEMBLY_ACC=CAM_ASM_000229 /LENGTH=91 /DNA_ID=CAMNT_0017748279 /DNA_START=89 /DNA_END=364 /DNA_ORIENTATION=-
MAGDNINRTTNTLFEEGDDNEENLLKDNTDNDFAVFRGAQGGYKNSLLKESLDRAQKMSFRESLMLMPADGDENITTKEKNESKTVCKVKL